MNSQDEPTNLFRQKRDEYLVEIRKKKNTDRIKEKRTKLALGSDGPKDPDSRIDAAVFPFLHF